MMANALAHLWEINSSAIAGHLWQSTLFAFAAALLTLALRKNQARHRYWLWLAASLKFLIPFSLLAAIGSRLPLAHASTAFVARLIATAGAAVRPFSQDVPARASAPLVLAPQPSTHLLSTLLVAFWLCGFLLVLFVSFLRWQKVSALARASTPLRAGREFAALRQIERAASARRPSEIRLSSASLEPGVFGILHPVLLWPQGISAHLSDAQIESIIAHELGHIRRRDNLTAALHILAEAIFWFHPLVWWIGTRLVAERERACDEQVLEFGSERAVYAEGILRTCEFCSVAPLACVSGITGADLERRIVRIMTPGSARNIGYAKKFLLAAAGFAAIALPISSGMLRAASRSATHPSATFAAQHATASPQAIASPAAYKVSPVSKPTASTKKMCPKTLAALKAAAAAKSQTQRAPG